MVSLIKFQLSVFLRCELFLIIPLQKQAIPMNTRGKLYFSDQEGLDVSRNKVQSRPKIGKQYVHLIITNT